MQILQTFSSKFCETFWFSHVLGYLRRVSFCLHVCFFFVLFCLSLVLMTLKLWLPCKSIVSVWVLTPSPPPLANHNLETFPVPQILKKFIRQTKSPDNFNVLHMLNSNLFQNSLQTRLNSWALKAIFYF